MAGLGRCANINFFSFLLCVLNLINITMHVYRMGVLTTVENRFNLNSFESSFSVNSFEVGNISMILLLAYYARNSHIPRIVGIASLSCTISGVLVTLPHFIYGSGVDNTGGTQNGLNGSQSSDEYGKLCTNNTDLGNGTLLEACGAGSESGRKYPLALFFFIFSGIMLGCTFGPCNTLALAFVDKNVKNPQKAPLYIGIITSMHSVGSFAGFLLAALTTYIYIDPSASPWPSPKSPKWLGAWWLGFLIATAIVVFTVVPFFFFPPSLKEENQAHQIQEEKKDTPKEKKDAIVAKAKGALGIFGSLKRLAINPAFLAHMVGFSMDAYIWGGQMPFIAKFMEVQFRQTAATANLFSAIMSGLSCAVGSIVGGIVGSRVSGRRVLTRYMLGASAISTFGMIALMFINCETPTLNIDSGLDCNVDCDCSQSEYYPVCGNNGEDYLTPCHAGCAIPPSFDDKITNFSSCACLPQGYATQGECPVSCSLVFVYGVILFILGATSEFNFPVNLSAAIKVVDADITSFALGIMQAAYSCLAMIPGPSVYGALLDKICTVWQVDDCGVQGSCMAYDVTKFRYILHGLTGTLKFIGLLAYLFLFIRYRNEEPEDIIETTSIELPEKEKMLTENT